MNKNEFLKIAVEVIDEEANKLMEKGSSPIVMLAATSTMNLIVSKLANTIFDNIEEIEIER